MAQRKAGAVFEPVLLRSAAGGGNYSAAAGVVDIANSFGAMRDKAPKYDALSATATGNASAEKQAAMNADATVTAAGMQSYGQTKAAALGAEAEIKAAETAAKAQKNAALFGAIGTIGGALPSLLKKSPGALPTGATEWADWGDGTQFAANQNGRIIEGWGM